MTTSSVNFKFPFIQFSGVRRLAMSMFKAHCINCVVCYSTSQGNDPTKLCMTGESMWKVISNR